MRYTPYKYRESSGNNFLLYINKSNLSKSNVFLMNFKFASGTAETSGTSAGDSERISYRKGNHSGYVGAVPLNRVTAGVLRPQNTSLVRITSRTYLLVKIMFDLRTGGSLTQFKGLDDERHLSCRKRARDNKTFVVRKVVFFLYQ